MQRTKQEFPRDRPGKYINWLYVGPITAELLANYELLPSKDKIKVWFDYIKFSLGPLSFKKVHAVKACTYCKI